MTPDFQRYLPRVEEAFLPLFDKQLQQKQSVFELVRNHTAAGWTVEMADFLDEVSEYHFIDVYNRGLMMRGLKQHFSRPGCEYLDAGCSSGFMLEEVHKTYPHVSIAGCDYEPRALDYCRERYPAFPLFRVDLTDCPFRADSFDAITCLNVLEHIKEDTLALKELYRILKPGGMMGITVPLAPHLYDFYDEVHCHCLRYDFDDLLDKIRGAGFNITKANRFGVAIYPAFYLVKRFNKLMHDKKSLEQKYKIATKQAKVTAKSSAVMNAVCGMEERLGNWVRYGVGVRGYVLATKS